MTFWKDAIPAPLEPRIRLAIDRTHRDRVRVVAPLLILLGLWLLFTDLVLLSTEGRDPWLLAYLGFDTGFLVFNAVVAGLVWRRSSGPSPALALGYIVVLLVWAVLVGVVEYHRAGNYTVIVVTVLAVASFGLFPLPVLPLLTFSAVGAYELICALGPGSQPLDFEENLALIAVVLMALGISRSLYVSYVTNQVAQAELQDAKLSLLRQEKLAALGVLAAGIAHEVNNPLSFIRSNLRTLERNHGLLSGPAEVLEEDRQIFDETKEGFRRISEVVQALGTFGRGGEGGDLAPYDLGHGVRTALTLSRHESRTGVELIIELSEIPPVRARGTEINQVILNLLLNAYHAVSLLPGDREKQIGVRTYPEGAFAVLEVWNNGPPVPENLRERIFEPFFSTKAPGAGMGLGLSLSWEIALRHGGTLELLESEPVTFRLQLPLQASTQSTK